MGISAREGTRGRMSGEKRRSRGKRGCNIRDLAEYVGLSTCTVSKVLNNRAGTKIPERTQKRVLEAARQLDYVPNVNAQRLFSRRSGVIGLLVPSQTDSRDNVFSDTHFVDILAGMEDELARNGYHLLLLFGGENVRARGRCWPLFRAGTIDALLVWGEQQSPPYLDELLENDAPCLFITSRPECATPEKLNFVTIDYEANAVTLTRLLAERGCRDVLFLTGPGSGSVVSALKRGVERTADEAGMSLTHIAAPYTRQAACVAALDALRRHRFDGVVAAWSSGGDGVCDALRELGVDSREMPMVVLDADMHCSLMPGGVGMAMVDDQKLGEAAVAGAIALASGRESRVQITFETSLVTDGLRRKAQ